MCIRNLISDLKNADNHEVYPVAMDRDIQHTEFQVGRKLNKSFIYFTKNFSNGAYLFKVQEICSTGDSNSKIIPVHKAYLSFKNIKHEACFYEDNQKIKLESLIPFSLDSNGNSWCFIEKTANICYFDKQSNRLFGLLENFEKWLAVVINSKNEVIRELYSEEFILNVLKLG